MNKNIIFEDNAPMVGFILLYGKILPLRINNYSNWQPFVFLEEIANSKGIDFYFNESESIIALPIPLLNHQITHKAKIKGMPTFDAEFTIICGFTKSTDGIILKPLSSMSKRLIKNIEIIKINPDIYLN